MRFYQGQTATLAAIFRDYQGNLVNASLVTATITNPNGLIVANAAAATQVGTGHYTYAQPLAADAPIGLWRVEWSATVNGVVVQDEESFEVAVAVEPGISATTSYDPYVYVSRYATERIGIQVSIAGVLDDPDASAVAATMTNQDGTVIFTRAATRDSAGVYSLLLTSANTSNPAQYTVTWNYTVNGAAQLGRMTLEVGQAAPAYDALADDMKALADSVWMRFVDLFDSPSGGPHLQVYFQTFFGRQRIAQLMEVAVGRMNTIAQPHQSYSIGGVQPFPTEKWGPLLESATYVEVLKHLIRSYVEQPDWPGVTIARADRRDYMSRWREVLSMEEADLKQSLDHFKISNMGLGRPHVLVSGGAYGRGPSATRMNPARPRPFARFYT